MSIDLVKPGIEWFEKIKEVQKEFWFNKEQIHGSNGLTHQKDLNKWLKHIHHLADDKKVSKGNVLTQQFLIVDKQQRLVGFIDCRSHLTRYLEYEGGHIGYSIRKSERGHSYGKEALERVLVLSKEAGVHHVLLTCRKDNAPSKNIILSSRGEFLREIVVNNKKIEHYKINLS